MSDPFDSHARSGQSLHEDLVVYLHPNGRDYLANFTELGWQRWPAEAHGWAERTACPATLADACSELEPRLADLALRLSNVTIAPGPTGGDHVPTRHPRR